MENKNVMLQEGVYIKTSPTVLDSDRISILRKRLEANEIGEIVFNLECVRVLLTNNTNDQIIDDILNSDFDDATVSMLTDWFDKLNNAITGWEEAKKKPTKSSESTKTAWNDNEKVKQ